MLRVYGVNVVWSTTLDYNTFKMFSRFLFHNKMYNDR